MLYFAKLDKNLVFISLYPLLCILVEVCYMGENLVIVESPAKAKTIEKILGDGFTVKSSFGHIRDLSKKNLGIDLTNGEFTPEYEISKDKEKVVSELKAAAKKSDTIWLASDEDREGEAIAWHLFETLNLDPAKTKRIVFHEITPDAIKNAIQTPRQINNDLVMAQQARRVLDRLVGFELSPILWKKIKPSLSAGRVQSVALRLIVDREREIIDFKPQTYFRVEGIFHPENTSAKTTIKSVLDHKFTTVQESEDFLSSCVNEVFTVDSIEKKDGTRTPAPPFTTSSLQQEAARKCGFSVSQTMSVAQKLYESGLITYMRTDSTNLSKLALGAAKTAIEEFYGKEYSKTRQYKTQSKGAQEAHEAIRPTYISRPKIEGSTAEIKLYNLIWKRTIASQMSDAKIEKTNISIKGEKISEKFIAQAEHILFDGFLKVYFESTDDETETESTTTLLPSISEGQLMNRKTIVAAQKYTLHPSRYTEASLVKKMEELGIGRPSTYAPTISTITNRGYVSKSDKIGEEKNFTTITLEGNNISSDTKLERYGNEKSKLCPEDIGIVVTDFLGSSFSYILDYGFTAKVEESFDKVANGKLIWNKLIAEFYKTFHKQVEVVLEDKTHANTTKELGIDPKSGKKVSARIGKFGPLVQIGEQDDPDKKFASLTKGQLIETITLEEAIKLFELPREIGEIDGNKIIASIGRFGPYIKYGSSFVSIKKGYDPHNITLEDCKILIAEHIEKEKNKFIKEFTEEGIQVLNGRFGPYVKKGKENFKIPKGTNAAELTLEQCNEIITSNSKTKKKK